MLGSQDPTEWGWLGMQLAGQFLQGCSYEGGGVSRTVKWVLFRRMGNECGVCVCAKSNKCPGPGLSGSVSTSAGGFLLASCPSPGPMFPPSHLPMGLISHKTQFWERT